MFNSYFKFVSVRIALVLIITVGVFQTIPVQASTETKMKIVPLPSSTLGEWFALGSYGLDGHVNAYATHGDNVYVGGYFMKTYDLSVTLNDIASYSLCTVGPITVINASDSGAGSLRQAITDICAGGTINFDASVAVIDLFSSLIIDKDVTIDGSNLTIPVTLDLWNGNNIQILSSTVMILNLTIQRGYSSGDG